MPAQILPLIDEASTGLALLKNQEQQGFHEQQLGLRDQSLQLREAKLAMDQQLNPLRQQVYDQEIQKSKQAMDMQIQTFLRQGDIEQHKEERQGLLDNATLAGKNADLQKTLVETENARRTGQKQDLDILQLQRDIADGGKNDLQQKLMTQQLSNDQLGYTDKLATSLASIATEPSQNVRQALLQGYLEHGLIKPEMAQKIIQSGGKKTRDSVAMEMDDLLGEGMGDKFLAMEKASKVQNYTIQDMIGSGDQAGAQQVNSQILQNKLGALDMLTKLLDIRKQKSDLVSKHLEVGDSFSGSKISDISTDGKFFKLANGKFVSAEGKQVDANGQEVK